MPTNLESVGRRWFFLPALLAVVLAAPASSARFAQAQSADGDFAGERTYVQADGKEVEIKEPAKQNRIKIGAIVRAGKAVTAEEEKLISDHFRYLVAELTWKENIPDLPKKHKDLKTKVLNPLGRAEAADLHDRLNAMLLGEMQKVALDKRYPRAVRLNAVLLMGELDQREPRGLDAGTPFAEAEPVLFKILKDEKIHDAYRIEALVGLMRHAKSNAGLAGGGNGELANEMVKLLEAKETPKGKSPVGHLWLRMLACDTIKILARKAPEANQPKVCSALEAMLVEKGLDRWVRCHAAAALGSIDAKSLQATAESTTQALAALVVEISKTHERLLEAAGVEASKKKKKTVPGPAPAQEGQADAPPVISENAQRVASEEVVEDLFHVRFGLVGAEINKENAADRGLYAAGNPESQKFIQSLVDLIDKKMVKTLKDINNPEKTTIELLAEVSAMGAELEGQLKNQSAGKQSEAGQTPEKIAQPAAEGGKTASPPPRTGTKPPAGNSPAAESVTSP